MADKKKENKVANFLNREFWGMILTLFSAFSLFCLFTGGAVFYPLGASCQLFFLGVFGFFSYPLFLFALLCGIMIIFGRTIGKGKATKLAIKLIVLLLVAFCFIHLIASPILQMTFGEYVSLSYVSPQTSIWSSTFGGAVFAMINYGIASLISTVGAFILYIVVFILLIMIFFKDAIFKKAEKGKKSNTEEDEEEIDGFDIKRPYGNADNQRQTQQPPITNVYYGGMPYQYQPQQPQPPVTPNYAQNRKLVVGNSSFELKTDEDYEPKTSYGSQNGYTQGSGSSYDQTQKPFYYSDVCDGEVKGGGEYVKQTQNVNYEEKPYGQNATESARYEEKTQPSYDEFDSPDVFDDLYIPKNYTESMNSNSYDEPTPKTSQSEDESDLTEIVNEQVTSASDDSIVDLSGLEETPFDFNSEEDDEPIFDEPKVKPFRYERQYQEPKRSEPVKPETRDYKSRDKKEEPVQQNIDDIEINPIDTMPYNYKYNAPPTDLLNSYDSSVDYGQIEAFKMDKSAKIMNTLKILGGIETKVVNIVHGPTVTRFDIAIPENVSVKTVMKYSEDLSLRLETTEDIRFAPIKGTPFIGIEIPNKTKSMVGLRDVVESDVFKNAKPTSLTFAIGKDLVGNIVVTDICKMPHLLVAGATGTGKSVGLNSMLVSLMMKYSPADLRFIIVDPKFVEFAVFENSPHMLFNEILNTSEKAVAMLDWAVEEMDARYVLFRKALVQGIDDYNAQIDPRKQHKMYRIVIIIDEFADLMSKNKKQIEEKIARIAQKARAAGIYLILATQRPSVNIMEGSIKTNFTSRMAFKMSNAIDSQTILGEAGAEKLLGAGDLLYRTSTMSSVERAQGAYVSMEEIKKIMAYIKENNVPYYNEFAHKKINHEDEPQIESVNGKSDNPNGQVSEDYIKALRFAVETKSISISLIQRRLGYGFPKAAKIFDWMTNQGFVLNSQTGKQKQVVLSLEEFEEKFGKYDI
ncbi:MAG: hypothetical protein IJC87_06010 [Clostridia bacterium]|nr:hypothetical protein [Clostridia bacterium]